MSPMPGVGSMPKDMRRMIVHLVRECGWTFRPAGRGGHGCLYPTDKSTQPISLPSSPSDFRAYQNFRALVRRAGGTLP